MLEARGITAAYGRTTVLDGVSVALAPGEIVVVAGPNGAGKSTLLAALSGAVRPVDGRVLLDGAPVADLSPGDLARRRAVLDQTPARDLPFRVEELIALGLDLAVPEREARAMVAQALGAMGLEALRHRPVSELSGGEAHRAHLARTLAQLSAGRHLGHGRYLLIDEPTAGLDLYHQRAVLEAAQRVARDGAGVLIVLHDLSMSAAIADRVVLLSKGRLAAEGVPHDVLTPDRLATIYGLPVDALEHRGQLLLAPRYIETRHPTTSEETRDVRRNEPV